MITLPRILPSLAVLLLAGPWVRAQGDIENVIVETYYISDAQDATDQIGGTLTAGSRTYRVFIDLCADCSLRAIYGDANHELRIESTATFFNNLDRGRTYGHLVNTSALDENTAALDSWLTLGAASNTRMGILKAEDPDGSIVGGPNNDGGSAGIPGGLLVNADPDAGFPLTDRDGLVPQTGGGSVVPPNFNLIGDDPTVVFGTGTVASIFASHDIRIGCAAPGVKGPTPENKILVAQLTTTGDLSFRLNVEVQRPNGTIARYVASDSLIQAGEIPSGLLNYPPTCGCTDPNFLEYDPSAGCDDGSCATVIVFGCLDTLACNFDPNANFNITQLCCYGPGNCNGLSVELLCPWLVGMEEMENPSASFRFLPNPVQDQLTMEWDHPTHGTIIIEVHDVQGRLLERIGTPGTAGAGSLRIPTDNWPSGIYVISAGHEAAMTRSRIVKH